MHEEWFTQPPTLAVVEKRGKSSHVSFYLNSSCLQENRYNKSEQLRFREEVAILKTLQHPNILRLYESWEVTYRGDKKDRKVLVLVTELMTSGTLKGYVVGFLATSLLRW